MQPTGPKTLEGWKEIAAYFRVSVRTVQQWEAERGLPVQRLAGGRGRVWIEVERLESWRSGLSAQPVAEPESRSVRPFVLAAVSVVVLGVLGLVAWMSPVEVAKVVHDDRQLVATDVQGRVLWTHKFGNVIQLSPESRMGEGILVDLDGDGQSEVIARNVAEPGHLNDNGLFCLSSSGQLKWHFQPGKSVRTAQGVFDPPYHVVSTTPFRDRDQGPWRIAVVSIHSTYFPAQVAVLDNEGKLLREYWHAGHLHDVEARDLDGDGRVELYAVGLSNGYRNAVVLGLDPERMAGAGWEESDDYRFESMKPGVEIIRLLTPRTPLSRRITRYNVNLAVDSTSRGLVVTTYEFPQVRELALCLTFGPRLSNPEWSFCDVYQAGLEQCRGKGVATTETRESEARGTTGFKDVTYRLQEEARRRTTDRLATK